MNDVEHIKQRLAVYDRYAETRPASAEDMLILFPHYTRQLLARIEALERQVRVLSTPFADVMAELGLTDADLDADDEAR